MSYTKTCDLVELLEKYLLSDIQQKLQDHQITIQVLQWMDLTNSKDYDELTKEINLNTLQR